ncbi:translation initiation factor IF-2 [Methyloligella solikamskensis]|uniref:Translation initiation factor IF-2 n=1 Tax=Methyloligella solikamskensis TaxID=1177756 RepID=A0ABW3JEU1_9HYPH
MSDTNETDEKTSRGSRNKLSLNVRRTVESGHVRQNFSHGRSKSVLVEKKKRRSIGSGGAAASEEPQAKRETKPAAPKAKEEAKPAPKPEAKREAPAQDKKVVLKSLSDEERDARARALSNAKERDVKQREREEIEAQRAAERAAAREAEEAAKRERRLEEEREAKARAQAKVAEEDEKPQRKASPKSAEKPSVPERKKTPSPSRRGDDRRVRGRLTITNALDEDQRQRSLASLKRHRERQKKQPAQQNQQKIIREVTIPDVITIQELANRMAERGVDVIKFLMKDGEMHKITDVIDGDTAQLIAEDFGHTVRRVSEADVEEGFIGEKDAEEDLKSRAPIVTIMGHVDHGKTSLLDALRTTDVVGHEAGGITQHIGAYQLEAGEAGQKVTFIDTPGHEAFTAMRARGAKVTDIVVLVVAADDGVMPQTVEAINHARAANVPIIVAINKIDKQGADPSRVRTDLLSHEIVVESMGGDTLEVEVSALKRTNLDKLLEALLLQSEVMELKANPDRAADGVIVEAKLERGRGPVGTALVQRGTLKRGDIIVAGTSWGRVRALIDDHGEQVDEAGPSVPVEVLGFDNAPEAGDQFAVVENETRAREITDYRQRERRKKLAVAGERGSLEQMMNQLKESGAQEFPYLIKGDVQGSVEAITSALDNISTDEVRARPVHSAVGGITESDISLAAASNAIVFGFNVRANAQARQAAEKAGVEIRYYSVIYDLVDDVKDAMSGMLSPDRRETFLGNAKILEVFHISKVGKVAGCQVTEGKVERGAHVRLIRDDVVVHEGKLSTLKRFKDEVKEVQTGQECGMAFENYQDMREGDVIECFTVEHVERTL